MITIRDKKYAFRHLWVKDHYVSFNNHLVKVEPGVAVDILRTSDDFEIISETSDYLSLFDKNTWTKDYKKLYWDANADTYSGFGTVSMNAVKSLSKLGIDVVFGGKRFDEQVFPDTEFDKCKKSTNPDCVMIQYRQPGQYRRKLTQRSIGYTPWETTKVPASWVPRMNEMEAIFTTCKQNVQAFKDSGIQIPVYIYHHGIDPIQYPYIERPDDPVWVFGTLGRLSVRKGTDLVLKAFREEFKREKDVALILKSSDALVPFGNFKDDRITIIGEIMNQEKQLELLKTFDVFLFPSRGEGFGLPAIEAMATGLPTIMTNWSGLADFGNKEDTLLLDYKMELAENFTKNIYHEDCGYWAEPDFDQLKKYMRWSYEHRKEARAMGKRCSERIHKSWKWEDVTKEFIDILNKII